MASIPAMAINSAVKGGFFGGLSRGVGKTISQTIGTGRAGRIGQVKAQQGISNRITSGMQHGWGATGGSTIRGIRTMKGNWSNPYMRGYGAGTAIAGLGTAWVGMGAINIIRPGDNIGLF